MSLRDLVEASLGPLRPKAAPASATSVVDRDFFSEAVELTKDTSTKDGLIGAVAGLLASAEQMCRLDARLGELEKTVKARDAT